MGTESSSTTGAPKNVSRRRVVAGAAWSVPAVMVASAAPAVAASKPCLSASFGGNSCKFPGSNNQFGYRLELCFTNTCATEVTVHIISVESTTGQPTSTPVNRDIVVPATGQQYCDPTFVYFCSTNSADKIAVRYSIGGTEHVDVLKSPVQDCVGASLSCPSA